MHRFGNPTKMIDGCAARMKFMGTKGMLWESIHEFKEFIIDGITQLATTYESAAAFVRLIEEDDRETVTRLFHLSSQIENLRMKSFNVCASFSLEQPHLPEDVEEYNFYFIDFL